MYTIPVWWVASSPDTLPDSAHLGIVPRKRQFLTVSIFASATFGRFWSSEIYLLKSD